MDLDVSTFKLSKENSQPTAPGVDQSPAKIHYKETVDSTLLNNANKKGKVLSFKTKAPAPADGYSNSHSVLYSSSRPTFKKKKSTRAIPSAPSKVLDAPEFVDDYYLNLLDWSSSNILAIALGTSVYLLNCETNDIQKLMNTAEDDYVCSLSWMQDRNCLAVGTASSVVQLWDADSGKMIRKMASHTHRVSSLSWNKHLVSSGSRDSEIHHHDVRQQNHLAAKLVGHTQEVCGLKWSPDGTQLASGSNDNLLQIWSAENHAQPKFTFNQHQAAVKALAWCPWQPNTLASGGGTNDRSIRFWNTQTGAMLNCVDTRSQVCSIQWSKSHRELVSSHGFSQNQLIVWKYPSMVQMAELTGHTSRVLHMAMSPDGSTVVSAAGDETLRFWNVFSPSDKHAGLAAAAAAGSSLKKSSSRSIMSNTVNIR